MGGWISYMDQKFKLTFSHKKADLLRKYYKAAQVILEYGSGGSTILGASLPNKLVFSVESDRQWAIDLQCQIDTSNLPSPAIIQYVNIGKTGEWGRPIDSSAWQVFHLYPLSIWGEKFFRQPDLVLIDGRFRPACFAAICMQITRPTTILFDDYVGRKVYHAVEEIAKPTNVVEDMAVFELEPRALSGKLATLGVSLFSEVTYIYDTNATYRTTHEEHIRQAL